MRWPGHFSKSTPDRLWSVMVAAWTSGCAVRDDRVLEDVGHWERNLLWVLACDGKVVPELNPRSGRRLAKRSGRRKTARKLKVRRASE